VLGGCDDQLKRLSSYYLSVDRRANCISRLCQRAISCLVLHNTSPPIAGAPCCVRRPSKGNLLQFERAICAASDNKRHQFRRRRGGHSTCFRPTGGSPCWRWRQPGERAIGRPRQRDGAMVHRRDATRSHLGITQRYRVSFHCTESDKK